jgi:TonB family protein
MTACGRCSSASFLAFLLSFAPQDALAQERQKPADDQKCTTVTLPDYPLGSTRPSEPDSSSELAVSWRATAASIDTLIDRADIDQPGVIVVEYDAATRKRSLELDDLDFPKPLREEITRRIDLHFNRWPEPFRILTVGSNPETKDAPNSSFVSCPPALRNREYITRLLKETVARYPGGRDRAPSRTVNVWLFTNKSGRVLLAHVKDPSGDRYYDREAKRIGREFQFHPHLQDGIPTNTWINIPIVFAIRR